MKKYISALLVTSLGLSASELAKEVKTHQNIQKQKVGDIKSQKKVLQEPQKLKIETRERDKEWIKRESYPRGVIETH